MKIYGVKLKLENGIYYFSNPDDLDLNIDDYVVIENNVGLVIGKIVILKETDCDYDSISGIIRKATSEDIEQDKENEKKSLEAVKYCEERAIIRKLDMKIIKAKYSLDRTKIMFYFTAEGRIDFRLLVKDLAYALRTRIELRQVGVRDEAKALGGLGVCGRPFCCTNFLRDFEPVSIKMAKEQGLSLNPVKISGTCGRLMCCLKYEQNAYLDLLKNSPKVGAYVSTPEGTGTVISQNLLIGKLTVKLDKSPDLIPMIYDKDDVVLIRDSQIKVEKKEIEKFKDLE